jgi:hypothetical protein
MANEIYQSYESSETLYAVVYAQGTAYVYNVTDGALQESEVVYYENDAVFYEGDTVMYGDNGAAYSDYAVVMTAAGDLHMADFPAVAAGAYVVQVRVQSGSLPQADDFPLSQGFMEWTGTAEITLSTLTDQIETVEASTDSLVTAQNTQRNTFPSNVPADTKPKIINL